MDRRDFTIIGIRLYARASRACQRGCVVNDNDEVAPCQYHSAWLNGVTEMILALSPEEP